MKVLLIYPKPDVAPFYLQAPIGLLYIASALVSEHEVQVFDHNVDKRSLDTFVQDFSPDLLGVSFTSGCLKQAAKLVERYGKGRWTIAGGAHPTYRQKECHEMGFDIVARGDVDDTIAKLVQLLENHHLFECERSDLPRGYFFKNVHGRYVDTGISACEDVNVRDPARYLMPKYYQNEGYTHGAIIGSRGCYFKCVFCSAGRDGYRQRTPEKVVDEMEYVVHEEGHQQLHFADDIFTQDANWVRGVCQEVINRGLKCSWSVNSRSDVREKDFDIFDWMYRAGCRYAAFGVESGNQHSLKVSRKGVKVPRIAPSIQKAKEAGIHIRCNLMVGLPGANYQENLDSIDLVEEIMPNQVTLSLCTPYPGSQLDEHPDLYGIRIKDQNWSEKFQRDYVDVHTPEELDSLIEFKDISSEDIFRFVETLRRRLKPLGFRSVTDEINVGNHVVKTFLDRPKLLTVREKKLLSNVP